MSKTDNTLYWNEAQINAINAKSVDALATEVWEVLSLYNEELSNEEKELIKEFLISWKESSNIDSENYNKVKEIISQRTDNTKNYCLIKLRAQDDLLKNFLAEPN